MISVLKLQNANIFQKDTRILKGVTFELFKGDFAYLIGRTGSGKSSLLKTLYGELPMKLAEGKVRVAKHDLHGIASDDIPMLRRKLGIIFQDFKLLTDRNVHENLRFVLQATGWKQEDTIHQRINEVLDRVGLKGFNEKMPFQLSGGEQQRVVIARAMLNRPEVILADEPTGNLDPETSDEIVELLHRIAKTKNTAVLMATHSHDLLKKYPARVFNCIDGEVKERKD